MASASKESTSLPPSPALAAASAAATTDDSVGGSHSFQYELLAQAFQDMMIRCPKMVNVGRGSDMMNRCSKMFNMGTGSCDTEKSKRRTDDIFDPNLSSDARLKIAYRIGDNTTTGGLREKDSQCKKLHAFRTCARFLSLFKAHEINFNSMADGICGSLESHHLSIAEIKDIAHDQDERLQSGFFSLTLLESQLACLKSIEITLRQHIQLFHTEMSLWRGRHETQRAKEMQYSRSLQELIQIVGTSPRDEDPSRSTLTRMMFVRHETLNDALQELKRTYISHAHTIPLKVSAISSIVGHAPSLPPVAEAGSGDDSDDDS